MSTLNTATAELFIRDYLAEKLRLQKLLAVASAPIQEKFFAKGYTPNDTSGRVKLAESEVVLGATAKDGAVEITTTGSGKHHRNRYRVISARQELRIALLEMQCGLCSRNGSPKKGCRFCGGAGWMALPIQPMNGSD